MTTKMLVMLVMLMVMMNDNNGNDDDNDDDNLPSCYTWQVEPIEISKPATVEPPVNDYHDHCHHSVYVEDDDNEYNDVLTIRRCLWLLSSCQTTGLDHCPVLRRPYRCRS